MVGTKVLICGIGCGVWMSLASARADDHAGAPRSLRMRSTAHAATHAKRVGQVPAPEPALDEDLDDAADATDAADGAGDAAADAASDAANAAASDAPAAAVDDGVAGDVHQAPGLAPPAPAPVTVLRVVPRWEPLPELAGAAPGFAAPRPAPSLFTVTGSLIPRATLTTPSLLTVLRRDDLLAAGRTMVGDILQPLPEQGNALNAQFNNGGDGSTRISLRGLGIARTLTLLNGRRYVPGGTGADASVDLNTIPLAVIDRVEVLKDGGSAVYGSDAVAGVVNIITRTTFQGTEASLYTAQTERKDGFSIDASVITGHRTADGRGNIIFAAETQQQDPVFAGNREFSRVTNSFDFVNGTITPAGSTSTPGGRLDAFQIDVNGDGRGDRVNVCGLNVRFCTSDGRGGFRPFVSPADLFNFQPDNYLYTPSARASAYTAGSYTLAPHVLGFFEANFQHRASDQRLAAEPLTTATFGIPISRNSIYNPFGGDVLSYNRRLQELGPRQFLQSVDTMRAVVGARGDGPTPDSWQWEVSYNYGRTDSTNRTVGQLVLSRLRNAVGPSFIGPAGPTCGTPSAPIQGCVPINLLGPAGSISPEGVNYAGFTGLDSGDNKQQVALATAQRRIAQLPSRGDVTLAVSAEARKETGDVTPDALIASGDTTANPTSPIHGTTKSVEASAELSIVGARDRDGVERLELDLAARAFRFDTFGRGTVTSARALIRPVRGITLRASRSETFRAPSITELFAAKADAFPLANDPCDHAFGQPDPATAAECAREGVPGNAVFGTFQQHAVTGGNLQLQPETAKVTSAGVVLESPRAPGLSLSVDAWMTEVTQAVQAPLIQSVFASCYQRGIRSFCDLIRRNPAQGFAIDTVDLRLANFGGDSTSGVDTAVHINHHVRGGGDLHARVDLQTLNAFDHDTGSGVLHGLGVYDLGIYPKRKATVTAVWQHPSGASAGFNFLFVDSFQECENNDCNDGSPSRTVESYSKLDVFSSMAFRGFGGHATLTVGVNNVFDRAPPVIYNGAAGNYDTSAYDMLGRFAYARLTQTF